MELRQLTYFVAIVENGTVSKAAQTLHMSQPPMTAQIHGLEQELGCSLFEHSGRRLRLTDNGQAFYLRAKAILEQCREAKYAMSDLGSGTAGILRLGIISSYSGSELVQLLTNFHTENPGIRYELREANTYQLLSLIRQKSIELAIIRTPFAGPDLTTYKLRTENMQAVGHAHFFADTLSSKPLTLSALKGCPLLIYRRWETIIRDYFARIGEAPVIQCVNDSAVTTLALAQAGLGLGIVPSSALRDISSLELCHHPIDVRELQSELNLVHLKDAELSAPAQHFFNMLTCKKQ